MPIDEALVRQVARLARLKLSEHEITEFTRQLGSVLAHASQLQEVPLDSELPAAAPRQLEQLRSDEPRTALLDADDALANAPQRIGSFFAVPTVLDAGGA